VAILAHSVNLKREPGGEVIVLAPDLFFELSHFLRKELHRTTAFGADHVVMAAPVVLMLVTCNTVVEGDLARQAALRQQLQRAVDGGIADASVFFLYEAMQFISREMVPSFEKCT